MDSGAGCQAVLQPTMSVRVLGCCLDAARLPIDHFFYYGSKDKSSFTTPSLCEGEELFISDIHLQSKSSRTGWSPQRQNVGCWNFCRSTTNIISASLATSSLPLAVWNTIWVGPSLRSLRLNKKATRVRQSTQLLLTQFAVLLAREGGLLNYNQIKLRSISCDLWWAWAELKDGLPLRHWGGPSPFVKMTSD